MNVHFELSPPELALVKEVYDRLTEDDLMMKCLAEWPQNPNESLHSYIQKFLPKHKNRNKPMLDFAVAQTVAKYNSGYEASCLNTSLGVPRAVISNKVLQQQDLRMNVTPVKK